MFQKLVYKGNFWETMSEYRGGPAYIVDESGGYSRHAGFVQAMKRFGAGKYTVFSRKGVCYIHGGD